MKTIHDSAAYPIPELPQIPQRTFRITDYGAEAEGLLCTSAIQDTLDACAAAGGGTVIIPPGIWRTGPLTLHSRINLCAERGRWYALNPTTHGTRCCSPITRGLPAGAARLRWTGRI